MFNGDSTHRAPSRRAFGRIGWLIGAALAILAYLCSREALPSALALVALQISAALLFGKLQFAHGAQASAPAAHSSFSWGGAQFGFLAAAFLWEQQVGFKGGEATWVISIGGLLLYYGLARLGCLRAGCCRASALGVDSRALETWLSVLACGLLIWLVQSGTPGPAAKYVALACLACLRFLSLLLLEQRNRMHFEALGFLIAVLAFIARDFAPHNIVRDISFFSSEITSWLFVGAFAAAVHGSLLVLSRRNSDARERVDERWHGFTPAEMKLMIRHSLYFRYPRVSRALCIMLAVVTVAAWISIPWLLYGGHAAQAMILFTNLRFTRHLTHELNPLPGYELLALKGVDQAEHLVHAHDTAWDKILAGKRSKA